MDLLLKKEWFEIKAPKEFGEKSLGATLITKTSNVSKIVQSLKDRNYEINLTDIKASEDSSHKKLTLRHNSYEEKNCYTRFYGLDTTRDKFFSLIRKWQTIVELNSDLKTKDGYFIRVFLIGFSRKRRNQTKKTSYINTSQIRTIRRKMSEILVKEITNCSMKELIPKILSDKLCDEINFYCSKIFPLQNVIVRKIKVLEGPKDNKM